MKQLKVLLGVLLSLAALPLLAAVAVGLFFARLMINPPRGQQWKTPSDEGWEYENVYFEAEDGVPISSWFIPAPVEGPRPTVVIVHGWMWNRLGPQPGDLFARIRRAPAVELLETVRALRQANYHVLMFDQRNHGRSGSSLTVTFGHDEANDLLGAVRYLRERQGVDAERIGVIGYSMGANTAMFACSRTEQVKAAIAVQPLRPHVFARRLAASLLGPLGGVGLSVALKLYHNASGPLLETLDPAIVADLLRSTAVMYVQGDGDAWGSVADVQRFYELSQEPRALRIVPTGNRHEGYLYLQQQPQVMLEFFEAYLAG